MENFDRENIDELLEICQIRQYFPCQNFVLYGISILCVLNKICLFEFLKKFCMNDENGVKMLC